MTTRCFHGVSAIVTRTIGLTSPIDDRVCSENAVSVFQFSLCNDDNNNNNYTQVNVDLLVPADALNVVTHRAEEHVQTNLGILWLSRR